MIIQDITERKQLERELRRRSERDPLTGIYNRRHFEIELHRAVRLAERHGGCAAMILLDVDNFKRVNDMHGHPVGDELLRDFARVLAASVRATDIVARLGGDEFAVLLLNVDESQLAAAAQKVLAATSVALRNWQCSASAGAARLGSDRSCQPASVLAAADQALYAVKRNGPSRLTIAG